MNVLTRSLFAEGGQARGRKPGFMSADAVQEFAPGRRGAEQALKPILREPCLSARGFPAYASRPTAHRLQRGFTLIEIIVTLLVVAVLAGAVLFFIQGPVKGFVQQNRREAVVAAASAALNRMAEDIRGALPNSVRTVNGNRDLEIIPIVDAGRYRAGPGPNYPSQDDRLQFNQADDQFNIESPLDRLPGYPGTDYTTSTDRLVVYNTGQPGADAYSGSNVITPAGDSITISQVKRNQAYVENHVTLGSAYQFKYQSPQQSIYLVHGTTWWLCDTGQGTLRRYTSSAINTTNPGSGAGDLAVDGVKACKFQYQQATATRAGLVTLELTISQGKNEVHLEQQVHVDNVP